MAQLGILVRQLPHQRGNGVLLDQRMPPRVRGAHVRHVHSLTKDHGLALVEQRGHLHVLHLFLYRFAHDRVLH